MRLMVLRNTKSTRTVVQLPMRSQITFGGLPKRALLSVKSESFETMTKPFSCAYCQPSRSDAPRRPQSRAARDPGKKSERADASRGDRFSSKSSFMAKRYRTSVHGRLRMPGRLECPSLSDRENRPKSPPWTYRLPGNPGHQIGRASCRER